MKHLPILGLVVTVLGGLLYSPASWASGDALHLPGNLSGVSAVLAHKATWGLI